MTPRESDLPERLHDRYNLPDWDVASVVVDGARHPIHDIGYGGFGIVAPKPTVQLNSVVEVELEILGHRCTKAAEFRYHADGIVGFCFLYRSLESLEIMRAVLPWIERGKRLADQDSDESVEWTFDDGLPRLETVFMVGRVECHLRLSQGRLETAHNLIEGAEIGPLAVTASLDEAVARYGLLILIGLQQAAPDDMRLADAVKDGIKRFRSSSKTLRLATSA